jgi:hypothetical protein
VSCGAGVVERPRRPAFGSARVAVVSCLLRVEPKFGVCGDGLFVTVGAADGAPGGRAFPLVGERHERVRGAACHASEVERGDRQPGSGHVRECLQQQAGGHDHGRLRRCVSHNGWPRPHSSAHSHTEGSCETHFLTERPDLKRRSLAGASFVFLTTDGAKQARTADLLGAMGPRGGSTRFCPIRSVRWQDR